MLVRPWLTVGGHLYATSATSTMTIHAKHHRETHKPEGVNVAVKCRMWIFPEDELGSVPSYISQQSMILESPIVVVCIGQAHIKVCQYGFLVVVDHYVGLHACSGERVELLIK
jgi:hypothetical protein